MSKNKPKRLGMGLGALLGPEVSAPSETKAVASLSLNRLQAGKYQPRTKMDETALQELASSIATHGVMQPLVVRKLPSPQGPISHEIIAGERRYRAARMAGLQEVPVIEREVSDKDALAMALIENIQREDLSPLEEAQAIARLLKEFSFTHEQAAQAIGRSRSATTNMLRLLELAAPVQTMLNAGDIDMGHARALLALAPAEQILAANQIHAKALSVREAEKLVARMNQQATTSNTPKSREDRDTARLQDAIADELGMPIVLKTKGTGGELQIRFADNDAFCSLLERMDLTHLLEK